MAAVRGEELLAAADTASSAAMFMLGRLDKIEVVLDEVKRSDDDGLRERVRRVDQQISEIRRVAEESRRVYADLPRTVQKLMATPHTVDAVVRGLRGYRRTFLKAVMFKDALAFQFSVAKNLLPLAVADTHPKRAEVMEHLAKATQYAQTMAQASQEAILALGRKADLVAFRLA